MRSAIASDVWQSGNTRFVQSQHEAIACLLHQSIPRVTSQRRVVHKYQLAVKVHATNMQRSCNCCAIELALMLCTGLRKSQESLAHLHRAAMDLLLTASTY